MFGRKLKVIASRNRKPAVGTTNTTAGAKKGRTLKSAHLLSLTQKRKVPKKDSEVAIEPETGFGKHDIAPRWITLPQKLAMKIAFISPPVSGHLNPMTTLARKLQSRNHDVVFISGPDGEPYVHAATLTFLPYVVKVIATAPLKEGPRALALHGEA